MLDNDIRLASRLSEVVYCTFISKDRFLIFIFTIKHINDQRRELAIMPFKTQIPTNLNVVRPQNDVV